MGKGISKVTHQPPWEPQETPFYVRVFAESNSGLVKIFSWVNPIQPFKNSSDSLHKKHILDIAKSWLCEPIACLWTP